MLYLKDRATALYTLLREDEKGKGNGSTLASRAFVDCQSLQNAGRRLCTCKDEPRCDASCDVAAPCSERTRTRTDYRQ